MIKKSPRAGAAPADRATTIRLSRGSSRRHSHAYALLLIALVLALPQSRLAAQEAPTATPIQIQLATAPPDAESQVATQTPTWTATSPALAALSPRDIANVRAEPSLDGAILGSIRAGERYTITGKYFEWFQIQFNNSPTGRAWVFSGIVDVTGDASAVPEVTLEPLPTRDPRQDQATLTQAALALTPGGAETATVAARGVVATLDLSALQSGNAPAPQALDGTLLPTFTYPPNVAALAPTDTAGDQTMAPTESVADITLSSDELSRIPPIVPIILLGTIGALGLALNSLRRK
jgi:hypothetical protein